jgi:2-polyprenyl-6-hydroxyphenyl methylase/3-demethylubiquinone-9 3-methyltransferase
VRGRDDLRAFFDRCAASYAEQHGHPERLLAYRLDLVRAHARLRPTDVVLDVGCGPGHHLVALAPEIARGTGVDLAPGMIDVARARLQGSPYAERLSFAVDDAEELAAVPARSIDLVLCVGALEHMIDRRAALAAMWRTLKPGGRLFCLTPAGDYVWYRALAPLLGISTRHLSTDRFLTRRELGELLRGAGFATVDAGAWTFIPRGDVPGLVASALGALDVVGRLTGLYALRGGAWICAWKP